MWGCSLEDSIPENNSITGTVKNTSEKPLAGVTVKLQTSKKEFTTQTDKEGNYFFDNIRSGMGVLVFNLQDHYEQKKNIKIGIEEKQEFNITLRNLEDDYFFYPSTTNVVLENDQTEAKILINTNGSFKVYCISDWLTCTPQEGKGMTTITLTFTTNETEKEKEAIIEIEGMFNDSAIIEVKQKAGPVIKQ